MPQNIADAVNTWTTPLVAPANGDPVDGDGWEVFAQGVGNRTAYLREGVPGRAATYTLRILPELALENTDSRFTYQHGVDVGFYGWIQTSITSAGALYLPLTEYLPSVGLITQVSAVIMFTGGTGSGSHPAALPATKPKLTYWEDDLSSLSGNVTLSTEVTDTTTPVGTYLALHRLDLTSFDSGHDLDLTSFRKRGILFKGEAGANSAPGLGLLAIEVTIAPNP